MKLTGAQALIKSLEMEGVEVMFGLPGGCILPAYDPLLDSSIRHILVRHEQGAGHMAEGYAHVTGRPGVAMVTSGPAATNLVTPLCDAYMDSIPMVAITGQVPTTAIGTDAFQECDTVGITRSVTKHNELVMTAEDLPLAIRQAFHIATTGRPGPVLVDVPKDVLQNTMEWHWPSEVAVTDSLPGYRPNVKGHPRMIKEAARLILAAERPVLYVGGGILKARAAEALRELAELTGIHVVTTLMARGAFPDDHPLCLGMPGMHGNATAVTALQQADLLIALGARFDDRVTGKVSTLRARTPRSSTSTSTRPSRARSAGPTCPSWATAGSSSRSWSRPCAPRSTAAPSGPTRPPGAAASRAGASSSPTPTSRPSPARR